MDLKKKINAIEREMYLKLFSDDFTKFKEEVTLKYVTVEEMFIVEKKVSDNFFDLTSQCKQLSEKQTHYTRQFNVYQEYSQGEF